MMWLLRDPKSEDVPFVFNSWLKSFRDGPAMSNMANDTFYKGTHACIENVAKSPACKVVVACDPNDPNMIFGYGVAELVGTDLVLHWIYVKHPFRAFGLGRAIEDELKKIPHESVSFSCYSKLCRALMNSRKYKYDPFKFWAHK